jgi:Ca2+-binding RTX toxin-like protein
MPGRRNALRAGTALAGLLCALVLAPAAGASTVVVVGGSSDEVVFTASAGLANNVTVSDSGSSFRVSDPAGTVVAGAGCNQSGPTSVTCSQSGVDSIRIVLGDGDDKISTTASENVVVDGGAGNDTLNGGSQGDTLNGDDGDDVLVGGGGPDTMDGGAGTDRVSYEGRTQPVRVDLDGAFDDGEGFEWDNVKPTVEEVIGGSGADTFVGAPGPNVFRGGPGNDVIDGMDGDDSLFGDAGNDRLDGRAGTDSFTGGDGDDTLIVRDGGAAEQADCGAGADSATADREDALTGCETVDVPSAVNPGSAPAPTPGAVVMTGAGVVTIVQRELSIARNGAIAIKLACGEEQVKGCRGSVLVTATVPKGRVRSTRRSGPANKIILARSKFKLRRGRTSALRVRASRAGLRRAFGGGRKRVRGAMAVTMRNSDGSTTQITKPISLAAAGLRL